MIFLKYTIQTVLLFKLLRSEIIAVRIRLEICPEMHVNEIHIPHNRHHKVSSLMKFHQNTKLYQI